MATLTTAVHVPLEVYLDTTYRPDRDWIDGELKERNLGEQPHSAIQQFLGLYLGMRAQEWGIRIRPEQRVQTSRKHYRVADVCVIRRELPLEPVVRTPPLLCVEVLSKDDSMSEIHERVEDYFGMGVEAVWVIDPRRRRAFSASAATGHALRPEASHLDVPGTSISVPVAELFAELNEMEGIR